VKVLTWKNFGVLLALPIGGLLLYYGHFKARTNADAGLVYGLAAFLFYATGRKYFNHPVFETSSAMGLAVAFLFIYIGLADNHNGSLALGMLIAFAGFLAYGMEFKEKQLRERARRLGVEGLMFPKDDSRKSRRSAN
jgi:hypothetical protein